MAEVNLQDDQSLQFLENYINNAAPSGFESNGQQIWLDHLKPYIDDYTVDTYGTTVGFINHDADFKVVLEAHADEISWFINYIS
ncbi:MAG: peptidase M42, partial [Bacteroidetes bacterium SW_10_40_5]